MQDGTKVLGDGQLVLSVGTVYPLLVKGKVSSGMTSLKVSGDKRDPAAGGIKLSVVIETLEGETARVLSISGKAFGQALSWER